MFTRMVVPLDGTPFAEAALAPARELARAFGSRIVVVRSVAPGGLPRTLRPDDSEAAFERLDEADAYLHGAVDRLRTEGFDARLVLYVAEPGAGIAQAAELNHADLIVMTTHPRWKVDLLDNSSTTLQVLARSRVPILAWRAPTATPQPGASAGAPQHVFLARTESPVLVPLDGSPFSEAALPVVEALVRTFGGYVLLVRAIEQEDAHAERAARDYLTRMRAEVEGRGVGALSCVLAGSPTGVIDTAWRERDASLIVLASHGASGIARSFLGSVAARCIEDLAAPILIVRPPSDG